MLREDWLPHPVDQRMAELEQVFRMRFGREHEGIAQAPGRVNLIGEHLDYNDGLVLPAAIDRSVLVAFARTEGPQVRAYAAEFQEEFTFRLGHQPPVQSGSGWASYVSAVIQMLFEAGEKWSGADLAISGDVPLGAGLSSSAALELGVSGALRAACQLNVDDRRLAFLRQRAENALVGVQCGVMDQLASALGRAGHALLIDCRSLECEYVDLHLSELGVTFVVIDSGQRRRLEHSDYNRRREECAEALALLQACPGTRPKSLRDVTIADLDCASLPETLLRRVRHVASEQNRVEQAVVAARSGDLERFGTLMSESHASLRNDFEVSTPVIDRLVGLAQKQPGVLGARLTGAGFGGCTVNLVREHALDAFAGQVVDRYAHETKLPAKMLVCQPADGLRLRSIE